MENMNEQAGMSSGPRMGGIMGHWICCVLPIVSGLMWLAGVVFVILSWISVMNETGELWGYGPQWWIWNAVMLGILATYGGKWRKGRHDGNVCC